MTMTETMKDAASPGRGGRMSRQRKREAVLRLLRGEDLDTVSRSLGVTAATLSGWRDAFLAAGEASLATRPATGEALETERLKARLGAMLLERELLEAKIAPGERPPFSPEEVEAMSRALSPSSGQPYGPACVCRIWRVARASVYRHRKPQPDRQRRGPVGPLSDPVLTTEIRDVLAASPFHGEGHRKVWARLRVKGIRNSLRRVLRLMREHDLLAPSRTGRPRGPRNHDGTIIPETIDTMWGTDMTTAWTGEGPAAVFVAVDHYSAECVGIHASHQGTRFEASEPLRQGVREHLAALPRRLLQACRSGTITGVSTCHGRSRMSCAFSRSRVRLLSRELRKGMAVRNDSSARSRRTCCGCTTSRPSRRCGRRCWPFGRATIPLG
jgi:transposase-like protein